MEKPIIVGFVADLMFTPQIAKAAMVSGFQMVWVEQAADIGDLDPDAPKETPGEMLHGREGLLFQKITQWQPALLIFDLTNQAIPWFGWLPALKSSPATRRIPIIAFGPHEDVALFQTAKSRGADAVYARSRFFADLPAILKNHARRPDRVAVMVACEQPLPDLAREGIVLFNQGEYYRCHDALEEAWRQDPTPGRSLYQGILQYGIALYQLQRGNYRGAVKMLLRLRQWLEPLPPVCRGVNVARLRQNIEEVRTAVQAATPDNLQNFPFHLVAPIEVREP
ncbi:MAG: DUF309 domain-containing protein [Ardenticatenaceae bacterium]|nr:DUF309 domain-containing protein [Ardenticatenaceae bacterium]